MRKCLLLLMFSLLLSHFMFSQQEKATNKKPKPMVVKTVLPATLLLTGAVISGTQMEKNWQRDIRDEVGNDFRTHTDDYIQYMPFVQIYLGDIVGMEAKNHWFDQSKNIFLGGMTTLVVTHSLKRIIGKERPDGSSNHAFPSGHTGASFMGATMLYHEFAETSMLYASSGFLFAAATGGLRVVNNRHWVSDVIAGAGVGILVGNLIYHIEPLKNWNPFKKSKNLTFSPMIHDQGFSFSASLQF